MGKQYKQLTYEDRIAISTLFRAGHSKAHIAKQLGFHRSTIYRELDRNSNSLGYLPTVADKRVSKRKKRFLKLANNDKLRLHVTEKLKASWSPEQISGRLKLDEAPEFQISHETIYSYIYSDYGIRNKLYHYLRRKHFRRYPFSSRGKKISIPNRVSIHERPESVNKREDFGHWEGDLMIFKRGTKTNLITLRERKSRYIIAIKNKTKHAKSTAEHIIRHLQQLKAHVGSITFDNGTEFYDHETIAKQLDLATYFCDAYKSYQKGSVENGNGLLREYFPRDIAISDFKQKEIGALVSKVNNRPMRCLGYKTPAEVFQQYKQQIAV